METDVVIAMLYSRVDVAITSNPSTQERVSD